MTTLSATAVPAGGHRQSLPATSVREAIVATLREDIVTGSLTAGTQLKQDDLAARFGVSPAPIREALRQLENEGLVEHFPNRGVFVTDISAEDIVNLLLPVRLAIETFGVKKSAATRREQLLSELDDIVSRMRDAAAIDDLRTVNELDVQFHQTMVHLSGSEQAIRLWHSVHSRIRAQIYRMSTRLESPTVVVDDHQAILDAIRSEDPGTIEEVMHEHIIEHPTEQLRGQSD
ncbi:GntR family transcriptional regulator [Saccharopolyspora spinosa]|uniref:GntR family transcriptional regulator n=1 Tax=Saccharopolyspora spinosa TaxID=60894 RepID=UPI000A03D5E6|nr:GntR family transcriptional regulator [Saccharopolyspora spinosa]